MSTSLSQSLDGETRSTSSLEFTMSTASTSRPLVSTSMRRSGDLSSTSYYDESQVVSGTRLKDNINIQELTINKLRYEAIGLIGREEEVKTLRSSLRRIMTMAEDENDDDDESRNKEIVFLKGYSGVGKTRLVQTLQRTINITENGMYVAGKFDFQSCDEPYSGIAVAFNEICRGIRNRSMEASSSSSLKEEKQESTREEDIGQAILSALGSEISLLLRLIPDLDSLLPPTYQNADAAESVGYNLDAGKNQFEHAFRVLSRVLTSFASPMVLVLDDLQWADVSSLEILDLLISDVENTNKLMVVGCYRSNEVDENHILHTLINELSEKQERQKFQLQEMEIGSLNEAQCNEVIMALLSIDDEARTKALANICFKRTLGNPFFLIEFITMLEEEDLLSFNIGTLQWTWAETVIDNRTMSTENVVDLLQARMKKLPENVLLLMQYAACLGSSSVTLSLMETLWSEHAVKVLGADLEDISKLFDLLQDANFIEYAGMEAYRFVHDRVKEAALALGDASEASFQSEIGRILFHKLDKDELEKVLFDVTDLMNKGEAENVDEMVNLNVWAAEKAKSIAAFNSAASYVARAIELLPEDKWSTHRDVSLRLYTLGTQLTFALRQTEKLEAYSEEVLIRTDLTTLDKISVYIIKILKLLTVDLKNPETMETCFTVLHDLGLNPGSMMTLPVRALAAIFPTIRRTKKIPKEKFCSLQPLKDPTDEAIMTLLHRLSYAAYMAKKHFVVMWAVNQMVEITLERGVSSVSGLAFSSLGMLTAVAMKDFEGAAFFSEMALLLKDIVPSKHSESSTLASTYQFILPWTYPLHNCMAPTLRSYTCGLQSGNLVAAAWALQVYSIFYPYLMGKRLGEILGRIRRNVCQMEDFKQTEQALLTRMMWLLFLNLSGQTADPRKLTSDVFDCEKFVPERAFQQGFVDLMKLELFVFFGDFEEAAELALDTGGVTKGAPGHFLGMLETFHRGVALYAMARKTRKRKYAKAANTINKTIDKWVQQKNPNVLHYMMLLKAEESSLHPKQHAEADSNYRKAIALAARTGQIHQAALFNERYADFLFHRKDEKDHEYEAFQDLGQHHMNEAIRLYQDWGAYAKVEMLTNSLE